MKLIKASPDPPRGLEDFLREDGADGWASGDTARVDQLGLSDYRQRLMDMSGGRDLPPGWVPATTFWLLDDAGCVGGVSILRHSLTPGLLGRGGHISYYVKGSERGKGYGKTILALVLEVAREEMGLDRVLVTARSTNVPSLRVIEANGGKLEDERCHEETGAIYRRYWIELSERGQCASTC